MFVFYMCAHVFVCVFVCTRLAGGAGPEEAVSVTGWVCMYVYLFAFAYVCVFICVHMCLFVYLCALDWQEEERGLRKQSVSPDG